ncbi:helix-turn-helix domain-containing protein [Epilithonimonas sp. UC225_85]|uniref:helix-turn-helix domain-containing protein n=1 Tax=Epilithonimonas sp. UC225_85 TaxID=3350167 RepID=UPI0036D3B2C1
MEECKSILQKNVLSIMDVIRLDHKIFGSAGISDQSGRHRFYDEVTIMEMLNYQKKNNLNNVQLALHFRLSRNSVAKWKKIFNKENID